MVTAIAGIASAVLLINLSKASGHAKAKFDKNKKVELYLESDISSDDDLKKNIYAQVNQFVDSRHDCDQASQKISEVLNKELEKRVNLTAQELSRKYDTLVREKGQSEEIAWKKYNKVLTDKKRTESVIRSIAEGLVVVDAKGQVVMMNPAAEKLLGIPRKDKVGRSILENIKEEQLISMSKGADDKEQRDIELFSPQDETKKIVRASTAVIENENGQTVGMVSVLSDITKQKELDHLKSNFVTSVTHELRTPLVAVDKSITLLINTASGSLSQSHQQLLDIAHRNLKRLSVLINDLLDLSKLEAGRMETKLEPASVEEVINESVETLATWINTKSIKVEIKIPKGLPLANMDSQRIIQVLTNLIGNAIKFTPNDGDITVEAALGDSKKEIQVSVSDTGIGIDKEYLGKVFDKFYQVGERMSSDIHGTGVGLSIAKEIIQLHGGKIWAESEKGQGAKFIFTLQAEAG